MQITGLDQILGQLRTAAALAGGSATPAATAGVAEAKGSDFASLLKNSLDHVNGMQQAAEQKARSFELGAADASLPDVMVSIQKANVTFQEAVQVRNKLVSAYTTIMNMQV